MKKWTIFNWLKEIILTKSDYNKFTAEQWGLWDNYMILMFLSMNPKYLDLIDEIQELKLSKEKLYRVLVGLIPKNSRTFFPYIKSKTQKLNKEKLEYISNIYECSFQEANEYVNIMPNEWLEETLNKFGLEKKELKQLLKTK